MEFEHTKTDEFLAEMKKRLGDDCGIVAVKQDGGYSGTGPFMRPRPDFFVFPSGFQLATDSVAWNSRWGWDWVFQLVAMTEKFCLDTEERHLDLKDGYTQTKPIESLSPCLARYR